MSKSRRIDPDEAPRGLACPRCGCPESRVSHTILLRRGATRRRRECAHCGATFYTLDSSQEATAKTDTSDTAGG